ncbi:hypothetical protein [Actinomadura rubrisoli]|uniref:CU044_5270 family protein n=1 Tax=Actinomadura rubrisoli TaxID=2530368 RepID=A0A4V2YR58_9ACTN|nr:hypothetical protein [Actinomadura rubrisoli]TDD64677.1 hypothetical protein E1298_42180 [Actinomadura rubrisoli]
MDELTKVAEYLTPERPPSEGTTAAARRRLLDETAAAAPGDARRPAPSRRRALSSRRRAVLACGAAAIVLVTAGGGYQAWRTRPLYHPEPLPGYGGPAAVLLLSAADAKERNMTDGRFWYVHTTIGETRPVNATSQPGVSYRVEAANGAYSVAAKTENGLGDGSSEGWNGLEDEWRFTPVGSADRAAWERDGKPGASALGGEPPAEVQRGPVQREGAMLDFGVEEARKLPADASRLRAWLLNYATKFDHKRLREPDLYLFTNASAILVDRPVSDRVRIATYRLLASLKSVRMVTATDARGHTGQAVAMRQTTAAYGTIEWQLFIDRSTGRLTASQGVIVKPGRENAALGAGARQFFEVVEKAEWTSAPIERLRPEWINRMHRERPPR